MLWNLFYDEYDATMQALDDAWNKAYHVIDFDRYQDRYVIISDSHKGDRRASDDFQHNEYIYCYMLEQYLKRDFRLVLNGDIEEGWECDYKDILREYEHSAFAVEKRFVQKGDGYYLRIYGNHDHDWRSHEKAQMLRDVLGNIEVHEAVRLGNDIFIVHGHQGQPFDDPLRFPYSSFVVRHIWGPIVQGLLGCGGPSASRNTKIRKKRDNYLYEFARRKRQILVAGHTHEAMFQSNSKAGQFKTLQEQLQQMRSGSGNVDYEFLAAARKVNLIVLAGSELLAEDRKRLTPNYFNSGSCIYSDGITAIEIDRGEIRLVKWEITDAYITPGERHPDLNVERHPKLGFYIIRRVYRVEKLDDLFAQIQP